MKIYFNRKNLRKKKKALRGAVVCTRNAFGS